MQNFRGKLTLWIVAAASVGLLAHAQDAPSLGDAARKARQQKQQSKDTQNKTGQAAKKPHVINDEDVLHSVPEDQPTPAADPTSERVPRLLQQASSPQKSGEPKFNRSERP